MAFWHRLRRQAPENAVEPTSPSGTHDRRCEHVFEQIFAAAQFVHRTERIDRSHMLFDSKLGVFLADRSRAASDPAYVSRLTTAVLLSHCGYDAALIYVMTLIDAGAFFDVTVGPDIAIRCSHRDRPSGFTDVYGLACDFARCGALPQQAGPFRGPAEILWDAAFGGIPRSDPAVKKASDQLAHRVRQAWDMEPPPETCARTDASQG